ncbi:MAG: DUF448 domain-containing protein [Arcobacteraceae bacterium]|nr:DUF448 domain-containing protein [Arcobacteraceae bacterium]
MTNLKKPIRTCISCREKFEQTTLVRLQCIDKNLKPFSGSGRSFYLCNDCLKNQKRCEKALYRQCRNKDNYFEQLKEIVENG